MKLSLFANTFRRFFRLNSLGGKTISNSSRRHAGSLFRQATALAMIYFILFQSVAFAAAPGYAAVSHPPGQMSYLAAFGTSATEFFADVFSWTTSDEPSSEAEPSAAFLPPPDPPTITEAAVSRRRPTLNGGTITGSLRVYTGEAFNINSAFQLSGDLYTVGSPNIVVNSGASYGGTINDGGTASPSGYQIILNSGVVLPGKIHTRANAQALPADIPTGVPSPAGTRTVNINNPSDVNNIGSWSTLRSLNINPSNLTINVPPGNYDTFSLNGTNIKLVFSAGTYNFWGTVNLNGGSRVETNGATTINIRQSLNINSGSLALGANTVSSDVKLNVIGTSMSLNSGSQVNAYVRAPNANVNINNGTVRGHLIANYLAINSGAIVGEGVSTPDTIPPILQITSPANNSSTDASSVTVSGTATDSSAVASVNVNGVSAAYNAVSGTWNLAGVPLAIGSNTIMVQASDLAGNVTTQTLTVTRVLPPDTTAPSVTISTPSNNSTVPNSTITVTGTAIDTGAGATGINRVVVNGVDASYNPSNSLWTIGGLPLSEGANTITAVAYDNAPSQNSSQVSITVNRQTPDTQAPVVQILSPVNNSETYESQVSIGGTATDSGLNAAGVGSVSVNGVPAVYNPATNQWSLANVTLLVGTNTITVVANDLASPANSAQTSVQIVRLEIPPPTISISAPANNTVTEQETVTVSGLASAFATAGNQVAQVTVGNLPASFDANSGVWTLSNVPLALGSSTIVAKVTDSGGRETTAQVVVIREPVNGAPIVNAGNDQTSALPNQATLAGTATDDGNPAGSSLSVNWTKVSGDGTATFADPSSAATTVAFSAPGTYVLRLTATDGVLSSQDDLSITVLPENQTPQVAAGANQAIVLPNVATLNGTATDDGYPQGSSLATVWSMTSGPQPVVFGDATALSTTAAFAAPGEYALRLTATDGDLSSFDELTVTVTPQNLAPIVNAGADQSVELPNSASLSGAVTDDGLPSGATVITTWSKLSGPGDVTFADPNAVSTTASFSVAGTYEIRLEATDSELTSSDAIVVQVQPALNPPIANFDIPTLTGPAPLSLLSFSSSSNSGVTPSNLLDESRLTIWSTASGQNQNQFAVFSVNGEPYIDRVRLQQANNGTAVMLRDFVIQVSQTNTDEGSFTTVLSASLPTNDQLQEFAFTNGAVRAKFIRLIGVNTQGGTGNMALATFQALGAGTVDNIVSLPGTFNGARLESPSLLANGGAITRYSSFGIPPVGLINGGHWTTAGTVNEFAVIRLAGGRSYPLNGIRLGGNFQDYSDYWVKDFEVWLSNTTDDDAEFSLALTATKLSAETQNFLFPNGTTDAKYIKFVPKTSRGGTPFIGTMALEALEDDGAGIESFSSDFYAGRVTAAFDRSTQSAWYAAPGQLTNQWVKLRLAGDDSQKLYGVRIGGNNNAVFGIWGPRDYQIRVSNTTPDDAAFTVVKSGTLTTTIDLQEIRFDQPVDAKYVQFYFLNGYSSNSWLSVHTLEALVLASDGATLTSATTNGEVNPMPAKILDLDQTQPGWISAAGQNVNQSLNVRLYNGDRFAVGHIALRPGWLVQFGSPQTGMSPRDFEILVSTTDEAATSFTSVFSGTLQPVDLLQHFYFPVAEARFVKLSIRNNYGSPQVAVKSFYVYAENAGATDARFFDRSTDPENDIVSYLWNFGDGTTSTDRNPQHSFAQPGLYNVTLTVTDGGGAESTTSRPYYAIPTLAAEFSFSPVAPVESDAPGSSVYFSDVSTARLTSTGMTSELVTNGTTFGIPPGGFAGTLYADNGNYPATLRYGSDFGINFRTTRNVPVLNQPPFVDVINGKTVYWGENWTNTLVALGDPGPADRTSLRGVWNYGDGQTSSPCQNCTKTTAQGSHSYALPGNYTAALSITDKDGGTGSDSAIYNVIKRPTAVAFQHPIRTAGSTVFSGTLRDTFANQPLPGKPVRVEINGFGYDLVTGAGGIFEVAVTMNQATPIGTLVSTFAEDDLYQASNNVYSAPPTGTNPPPTAPTNGGTDFWLAFPANFSDGLDSQALLITSEVNTTATVTAACGVNQTVQITARAITKVPVPRACQLQSSDLVQNLGIRVTALAPVVVYGTNERPFTSDAFLGLPVAALGNEYYALSYGNEIAFAPSSQFGVVATENNTTVTINPEVTTGIRLKDVPYQITLDQGQTYLLKNTELGAAKDLTGSRITSDKRVAVFSGHQAATLPPPTVCCADHLVEQLPPANTWGKRFVLVPSTTRTKGDIFRIVAANDNTGIFINGARVATIQKGAFYESLIKDASEVITTAPVQIGQYATSSGFDPATSGADPFLAVVPPYSQFLNHYTVSTLDRFTNYINLAVPTSIVGQITLDGNAVSAASFLPIGNSGFSYARIPVTNGTHNLDGPAPFGVFSYGYTTDEGYGNPGGMGLIPVTGTPTLTLAPETSAFGIGSESCVTATYKDAESLPLGAKPVVFTVTGANPSSLNGTTDASGQSRICYTGANTGTDLVSAMSDGLSATATVIWSPPNSAPQVSAGDDRTITLPANANLAGTVTDDGFPANSLSIFWSKVSGPGNVVLANAASATTTANFSTDGVYVIRLSASDGQFTTTDEVTVTVNAAPPNNAPVANAGADQSVRLNANLVANPGSESELIAGEIAGWTEVSGSTWTSLEVGAGNVPAARLGGFVFGNQDAVQGELRQDIDISAFAAGIDAGTQSFEWKAFIRSGLKDTPDSGRIVFEYRDALNQTALASLDSGEITSTTDWHLTEDTRVPPAGTRFVRIRLIATRGGGTSTEVYFDALSLKATGNVALARLAGTASDDGLPSGNTLQKTWSVVSGPGNVAFADANNAETSAIFDAAGNYVLRLTADDGDLNSADEVAITVDPANQSPVVNAGTDQTLTLPATAQLAGTVSDDGGIGGVSVRWTKVSGPGIVSFNNRNIVGAIASFSLAGSYVLRLTATDGELESFDEVVVTVNSALLNQPPTVNAGAAQSITLPVNTAPLAGVVTDDGLPNGNLSIQWTKTSGAGTVTFADPNTAATTATFSAAGAYVLRLTASDGQYTVWKETVVTVYAEGGGGTNQPPTVDAGADQTITLSQTAILEAAVTDDGLPVGGSFSAAWTLVSGDGTVNFSNPDQTATYATFSQTGTYVVRLTVSDSALTATDDVTVTVIENQPAPTVEITTPADGASAFEPIDVTGVVSGGNWTLEHSLNDTDNLNNRVWTTLATGSGAASGTLGRLDTSLLLNGLYDIRLMTIDQYGRTFSDIVSVSIEKNLKVGHFTVSFDDMSVPVAGIPIQVIRTYDSRDKRRGDFGFGWTLSLRNVRVQKSDVLGLKWFQTRSNTFIPTYCVEPTRPHIVTVTMPDGMVEKFEAKLQTQCQQAAPLFGGNVVFIPQSGTRGRLEVIGSNEVAVASQNVPGPVDLIGFDGNGIFDRATYKYISKEGMEFTVNQTAGLQSVRDTNGNTLTISPNGITHSSGQSVAFTRDALGRITAITDPAGNSNVYAYDANGDLVSFTDRETNATTFTYEPTIPHHLKSIVDPLGRTPIRNDYDSEGRLLKHTDANGNEILYTHNLAARIETVTDRLGHSTVYEYDARGNVLVKRDALGHETTFAYDANDNVLSETDPLGRTVVHTYDAADNRLSTTDALGNRTEMTYNLKGQPLTVTDPRGNVTTNTYDTAGNLLTTTDAQGNVTTNIYSIQTGQLTRSIDALGHTTQFEYFGSYLTKQTDAQGNETTFGYDANGNRNAQTVKRTNAAGQIEPITTTFEFDNQNRLKKSTQPDGTFTRTEFNELGQQVATIDQLGRRTEFVFDDLGRQTKTIHADLKFEESTFDAEGRRLTSKDRAGRITSYEYDALGRLKKTTYSDGTFTTTNYDAAGQVLSSNDARGNPTEFTYDDAGRRLTIKNALDQVTSFAYDENGNQTSMTDALGHTTAQVYDSLNRRTRTNFADGTYTETTFDDLGRRVAERDQAGKVTSFAYDSLGRLLSVTDALKQQTRYEYNELGQQTKQIDAMNRTTRYEYDQLGRRSKRILPLGQVETYSYGTDGSLAGKTDFNGKTTTFAYDNMRWLIAKTPDASLNQPSISFTYNDLGQRATMTDASGTTAYSYDTRNRLQSKQTPFGTLAYGYDAAGNIETLRSSNANGVSVDYSYDELNRLSAAKDNRLVGNQTTTYTFDAVGNLQSYAYPNQVTTSYAYNDLNRLTAMTVSNQLGGLQSYAYTLGATGNRTKVVEASGRTVDYVYDDLYRLTSETIANSQNNGQITYQFDAVGNRLQRSSSVTGVPNQSPTYDNNDRLNSDVYDNNGSTKVSNGKTYEYDFENRLTSVSNGIAVVYDGDGNRVSKTANGVTTNYLVDTNNLTGYAQVVEEIQANAVVKTYTYGLDLISQRSASGVNFYQYDGHGSVRGLTDTSANLTDTYAYDAFGTIIEQTGTSVNSYLYGGEQFDPDLGFYYNRARYLNVETGRFWSMDSYEGSIHSTASLHKFTYAHNDPSNGVDPSGYFLDTGITFVVRTTVTNVSYPMYARILAGVAISLISVGSVFSPYAELESGKAKTRVDVEEDGDPNNTKSSDIVYRALNSSDNPAVGLWAKNVNATKTLDEHVRLGSKPWFASQYISTSRKLRVALIKYAKGDASNVVAIDLKKVFSIYYDLSTMAGANLFLSNPLAKNFAKADAEVVIERYIPPSAISRLF